MLLKHGEAIDPDHRQRLMEATRLAGESREGIRKACEVLNQEIEHVIRSLRNGIIFLSTVIAAIAGGVIAAVVIFFFIYPSLDVTAPPEVNLLSPKNRDTVSNSKPIFDWSDVSDSSGVTYTIQISNDREFSSIVRERPERTTSTYAIQSSLADGKYFWRVQAVDGAGNRSPFSEVFTFTVKTAQPVDIIPPSIPILLSPKNRDTVSESKPIFDWSDVSDSSGVTYTIQISSSRDFSNTVIDRTGRSTSTFTPQTSLTDGKYFWRVQAVDGAGNRSPFSEIFTFTLETTP